MIEFETKNITFIDKVETKEAERVCAAFKEKYKWLLFAPIIISCVCVALTVLLLNFHVAGGISVIPIIIAILVFLGCIIKYNAKARPYIELLKLASFNDKIRHEEKIRINERKRMADDTFAKEEKTTTSKGNDEVET